MLPCLNLFILKFVRARLPSLQSIRFLLAKAQKLDLFAGLGRRRSTASQAEDLV